MTATFTNTKLHTLLRLLDLPAMKQLVKFAEIFPDKDKQISKLLALFLEEHPDYEQVSKEMLYEKIYPDKASYNDKTMRGLFTNTKRLVIKFLSFKQLDEMEVYQKWLGMEYLLEQQAYGAWPIGERDFERQIAKQELQYPEMLHLSFRLEEYRLNKQIINKNRGKGNNVQLVNNSLDNYYIATKLRYSVLMLDRQRIMGGDFSLTFLDEIMASVLDLQIGETAFIRSYHGLLRLLTEEFSFEFCNEFCHWLMGEGAAQDHDELRQQFTVLLNIFLRKMKAGMLEYGQLALKIYQFTLEKGIIFLQGRLSPHHFRNMVRTALNCEEFEIANYFITKYAATVQGEWSTLLLHFNQASLFFSQGKFVKAQDCLAQIYQEGDQLIDVFYNLHYKTLQVQVLFELEDWSNLETNLQALKMFSMRNKNLSDYYKSAYSNFSRFLSMIYNKQQGKTIKIKDLRQEIAACEHLVKRKWLLEKV